MTIRFQKMKEARAKKRRSKGAQDDSQNFRREADADGKRNSRGIEEES